MTAAQQTIAMMCESDGLGGAEMVILRLAQALHDRGHRLVGIGPDELTQPDRGGQNGWLQNKFAEAGFAWRTYRKRRSVDFATVRQLMELLQELRVDVVHSHEFGMAVDGTMAARRLKLPHVITMHGNSTMTAKWTRRAALRWAFKRSSATVAVSRGTLQDLEQSLGLPGGRITIIQNGVPERPGNREAGRRAMEAQSDELVILAVGTLTPRKAHILLLQALKTIGNGPGVPRWRVAIAGAGDERSRLESYAREHGIADRVMLLGPRDDIPDLLAGADIFAMPSLWEGLPLALLEAMFARKAIVATGIAGIPEAIETERHGLLIPAGDVPALGEALSRLLADGELRRRLGEAARERAAREFSITAMTDEYERLYVNGRAR